ncbi:MAG: hypothetical protein N2657_04675 [bacterium]|nr:hypothetical protein [bacterium]
MNLFPIVVLVNIGVIFWILDSLWGLSGKQFLANFFFAGGLHPGEQYIYIIILSATNIIAIILSFLNRNPFYFGPGLFFFFLFAIIVFISTFFFSVDKYESLREFWIYILTFSLSVYTYNFVLNQKDKEEFVYNYSLLILIVFILSILISVIVSMGLPRGSPWMSLFYQKNAYGGFILLLMPISFSLFVLSLIYREYYKSILFFVSFIFGIFALIFSASKASFLSFVVCLPLYFGLLKALKNMEFKIDKKAKITFVISIAFSLFLLILQLILDKKFASSLISSIKSVIFSLTNTVIARVDFWEASVKIAKEFPFGCGLYNFSKLYPVYQAAFYYYSKDPHNYYLKLMSEVGYLGLFFFLAMVAYMIYNSAFLYKKVDLDLLKSDTYRKTQNIFEEDNNFRENLSKLGIYILLSGINIGLIQALIHIAFDVDFKFAYILIIFLINFSVSIALIDWFKKNNLKDLKIIKFVWGLVFTILSLFGIHYGISEAKAYSIDKQVEKTGDYKTYVSVIKNSLPSSSKYVTLAELYRVNLEFEEAIKYNKKAIELCRYNMNAYLSLAFLYNDKIESLVSIKDSLITNQVRKKILELSKYQRSIILESFKYDSKNYPDLYLLLAKSYEYIGSKNYKSLYKNIFLVIYPPSEYKNLMDIRYTTFGDVIAEAYIKYLIEDFIKCQESKSFEYCQKLTQYLYDPLIKYKIVTNEENFYVLGYLSYYITAKKFYSIDYQKSIDNFKKARIILQDIYTRDFVNLYYYTACLMYLRDYSTSLKLARSIFYFPVIDKLPAEDREKLKLVKINNYAILAQIYTVKGYKNLAQKYAKLYEQYSKK